MLTNEKLNRRNYLKGVSLGAGGLLFAPLLQKVAAAADGNVMPPKRVIFFLFDNGFQESAAKGAVTCRSDQDQKTLCC